jgi:hypothetical protein
VFVDSEIFMNNSPPLTLESLGTETREEYYQCL